MIETKGNIFDLALKCDVPNILLVTTNGCWDPRTGNAIMGAGIAKAAKEMFPDCSKTLGTFLRVHYERFKDMSPGIDIKEPWNLPYRIGMNNNTHIFSFPTKPTKITVTKTSILPKYFSQRQMGMFIEGWKGFSLLPLIERSAEFIAGIVGDEPSLIERVFSIRPGCANGGLDWESQVKPLLDKHWDSKYTIVELP